MMGPTELGDVNTSANPLPLTCHCQERKVHVVYLGNLPKEGASSVASHCTMLEGVLGSSSKVKKSLVYSYGKSFNGFSEMDRVVSVLPNTKLQLHTTRSWEFMGLPQNRFYLLPERDIIMGVLHAGIWPEYESFSNDGFGASPAKWKGICQTASNFSCNNKLIGARYYNGEDFYGVTDFKSPRDSEGHGTHTSSMAAGRDVAGASYLGLAQGIARGRVPQARITVYEVCWSSRCTLADILAAFDDAVADGVDIKSLSLGSNLPAQYFDDPIAIGAFHAMQHGILTSNSAGNSGPKPRSISNNVPWTLTVAASTINRKFVSQVMLGNGQTFTGNAINPFDLNGTSFLLIYGGSTPNVSAGASADFSRSCHTGSLNSYEVQGKIVLCNDFKDGYGVIKAHGLGNIMADSAYSDFTFSYPLPSTLLSIEDGEKVLDYIQTTDNPIGTIRASDTWKDASAPRVISFSSRGPNPITPGILKPDVMAHSVDILAAWSPVTPPSIYCEDTTIVKYNIISGTSMSFPHAGSAATFVKAAYPNWSPAVIKSALMTIAYAMDTRKNKDAEFTYGSGHINPLAAIDPELVYDTSEKDYVEFLCKLGYNTKLRLVTADSSICTSNSTGNVWDLNY